jgi:UDP-N-acetylmuramoylalanine--D-glutamate ligase
VVYGEAREELASHLTAAGAAFTRAEDLEEAIDLGLASAQPGDTLLLSPACSSFDAFASFEERGEAFDRILRARPGFIDAPRKDA